MTTLFVMGFAMVAMLVVTGLAVAWAALRALLWVVFLPLMLLKALFGLVFGLFGSSSAWCSGRSAWWSGCS